MKKIALLFPGQGSQYQSMMLDIVDSSSEFKKVVDDASTILGYDIIDIIKNKPEALDNTVYTQPILHTVEIALYTLLEPYIFDKTSIEAVDKVDSLDSNVDSRVVSMGHSLGEWSALTVSGAIDFNKSLLLVNQRATLMDSSIPAGKGAMSAVLGINHQELKHYLASIDKSLGIVEIANYNSVNQVVVAGDAPAIAFFEANAVKDKQAKKVVRLPVSSPSHCSLLSDASAKFKEILSKVSFTEGRFSVIHNYNASTCNTENLPEVLSKQLSSPLLWVKSLEYLWSNFKPDIWLEVGPGKVLSGINRSFNKDIVVHRCDTMKHIEEIRRIIKE